VVTRDTKGSTIHYQTLFKKQHMVNEISKKLFLDSAASWLCDSYSVDVRFIARHDLNPSAVLEALIFVNPLPILEESPSIFKFAYLRGPHSKSKMPAIELLQVVESASNGSTLPLTNIITN